MFIPRNWIHVHACSFRDQSRQERLVVRFPPRFRDLSLSLFVIRVSLSRRFPPFLSLSLHRRFKVASMAGNTALACGQLAASVAPFREPRLTQPIYASLEIIYRSAPDRRLRKEPKGRGSVGDHAIPQSPYRVQAK